MIEIGPEFRGTWSRGVLAESGSIYCAARYIGPNNGGRILKNHTINVTVSILNVEFPETGEEYIGMCTSGALALDGCIYFMPTDARRILRLNPEEDTVSSVRFRNMPSWHILVHPPIPSSRIKKESCGFLA